MYFSLFDIIVSTIFIASSLLGIIRGFVITSLSIVTFLLTLLLTMLLAPLSEEVVAEYIHSRMITNVISIIISYLLSKFACNWLLRLLREYVDNKTGGLVDKVLGLWIGAFRGYAMTIFMFISIGIISSSSYVGAKNYWQIFANVNSAEYPKWLGSSYTYNIFQANYVFLKDFLEGGMTQKYLENIELPKIEQPIEKNREHKVKSESKSEAKIDQPIIEDDMIDRIQNSLDKQ